MPNGSLDNTFGTSGTIATFFGASYQNDYSLALQSDGKILIGGYSLLNNTNSDFTLARYTVEGTLDRNFGTNGVISTPIGTMDDIATSIALQQDGKIVLAGRSHTGINFDFALVRFNNTITTDLKAFETKAIELTVQPNPFSTETMLLSSSTLINATITLYNSLGNSVKTITNVYGNIVAISRDKLPSGFYFIQLKQDNEMSLIKKLIISDN